MKKELFLLFAIVFQCTFTLAQDVFEFSVADSVNTYCISTFIDKSGNFISFGGSGLPGNRHALIMKFTNENDVVIKTFVKDDTTSVFSNGILLENGNYLVVGAIDNQVELYKRNLYVVEISESLDILKENMYPIPEAYDKFSLFDMLIRPDSTIFVFGSLDDSLPGDMRHSYFATLSQSGDLLNTTISDLYKSYYGNEILCKSDNNGYLAIGDFSFVNLIEFDNDLNIVNTIPMNSNYFYHGAIGARWLSDGNLVIGSLANQEVPGAYYDLHMRISDTDLVPLMDTVIFDDGRNWLPAFSGLDFVDEDNIWVVTYPQDETFPNTEGIGRIYLFDSGLNVKGAKYFGGSTPRYLYSIKALEDGGCIITGIQDDEGGTGYRDAYFKKVMPESIITHAEETTDPNDYDVLVYPVPFDSYIKIETYRADLSVSLYSQDGGKLIANLKLSIPRTQIETTGLNPGYYIYKISDNGKTIQSGKVLKQ
ncbi:MAG: T9SS type A sorting domain-containing protein [Bacteroidales bacterium]|nr:T9SS type A sorting domain-containing protein [Bacteroidales bacterium]MCF8404045.1 T9SS type A sorting domain-containing protein [Bacteroidales bacterium]